ncbi:MAG TPA: signal recognition particle-docking protein FtsY, partial [Synergistaceae bacterium]|nr:signal recognition particle-docking protein FtsY [Synergistaceae bacterium]
MFFRRLREGLHGVRQRWSGGLSALFSGKTTDAAFWDRLEELLIGGDVGVDLSLRYVDALKKEAGAKGLSSPEQLLPLFEEMMVSQLSAIPLMGEPVTLKKGELTVLVFVGVNGSGKTTTAGKLAFQWTKDGYDVLLAAADTFRAAAIDQLQVWGDRAGVRVVAQQQGSDAAAVVYDALQAARASGAEALVIDTAGRLHSKHNLMEELGKMYR